MALNDLLKLKQDVNKIGLSEERVKAIIPIARQYIAFYREYPDLYVDFLLQKYNPENFHLYYYQRVFLRAAMRYKYVYATFPRAYSKSFLSTLILMLRCILYPGAKLFVTSGGKEQASSIIKAKVQELCHLIPGLNDEIDWGRGKTLEGKDYVKYIFKNGSTLDNIAARETSRGQRRHGGLMEECVGIDGTILNEVIIPTMNVSRRGAWGDKDDNEVLNKSQIYITTAGWKGTFAYDKLIQILVWEIVKPERACILGGTWRIPVLMGLLDKTFIKDLKLDGTFNEASFGREYESEWSGTVEDAFFNGDQFDHNRILRQPEYEGSGRSTKNTYYVISVDVGRRGCDTVACVFKVNPQTTGLAFISLVNMYTYSDTHFEDQAIKLKKLYYKYKAKRMVIDGNGIGIGLVDYFVKGQTDPDTGELLPDFGVENDEENEYKRFRTDNCEENALWIIKANAPLNTEVHSNVQSELSAGHVKFLIDERVAKTKLLSTKRGQDMKPEERAEYLKPFTLTSILKEEMLNLREDNEGVNIILKQANKGIKKDKFSAFEYGLYYIKLEEDKRRKHKRRNFSDMLFMN